MARAALVSDMHGNAVGLEAALGDVARQDVDVVVSLGDVAQGGPQPAECVELLRELGCRCVHGNSDEFLLTLDAGGEAVDEGRLAPMLEVGRWSREQLGEHGLSFLRSFEPRVELELEGSRLVCCHGSPRSNEEVVLPETSRDELRALIGDADAVAGGHVHLQWLERLGSKLWCCAGSVGLVYEHGRELDERPFHPVAEYAVLTVDRGSVSVEFRRVPFDLERLVEACRSSGMPDAEGYAARWKPG